VTLLPKVSSSLALLPSQAATENPSNAAITIRPTSCAAEASSGVEEK
jgi:hypothetical protein